VPTIRHDDDARLLLGLLPGQPTDALGVAVSRSPAGDTWTVAGGPPASLERSIDLQAAAAGFRAVPGIVWSARLEPAEPPRPRHPIPRREYRATGHSRNANLTRAVR
jgi:hypothetical protein